MIRLVIYAILIYGCYRLLKSLGGDLFKPPSQPERGGVVGEAELIKDPQCGAYFLKQTGVEAKINGKPVFFCSESCREAYLRENSSH